VHFHLLTGKFQQPLFPFTTAGAGMRGMKMSHTCRWALLHAVLWVDAGCNPHGGEINGSMIEWRSERRETPQIMEPWRYRYEALFSPEFDRSRSRWADWGGLSTRAVIWAGHSVSQFTSRLWGLMTGPPLKETCGSLLRARW